VEESDAEGGEEGGEGGGGGVVDIKMEHVYKCGENATWQQVYIFFFFKSRLAATDAGKCAISTAYR